MSIARRCKKVNRYLQGDIMLTNNQINQIAKMMIESGSLNDDISEHIGLILENIAGIELLDNDRLNSLHSKIEQAVKNLKGS